jgi:hypothetical protein
VVGKVRLACESLAPAARQSVSVCFLGKYSWMIVYITMEGNRRIIHDQALGDFLDCRWWLPPRLGKTCMEET